MVLHFMFAFAFYVQEYAFVQVADVLAVQEVLAQLQLKANASLRKMLAQQD